MKIVIRLTVPDGARRWIALNNPSLKRTVRGRKAPRSAVITYIQDRINKLSELYPYWDDEPLTPSEVSDARDAIELLRGQGMSDSNIRAWLYVQRARFDISKRKPR